MASATSFLSHLGGRPPRYRTPSPPRRAIEPISPSTSASFRVVWDERNAHDAVNPERSSYTVDNGHSGAAGRDVGQQHPVAGGGAHHRAGGHGRTSSTIDTLATIALATSPTFAPLPYEPAESVEPHEVSPFTSDYREPVERPAKRARSEKDLSPNWDSSSGRPATSHASILDSMKTDAELLLNFARPSNVHPLASSSHHRLSVNEPYGPAGDTKWYSKPNLAATGHSRVDPEGFFNSPGHGISPSRMRSRSDGSAAIARPIMQGLRPNTSSSNLPPVIWQADDGDSAWLHGPGSPEHGTRTVGQRFDGAGSHAPQSSTAMPPKKEDDEDTEDSNQATCAACNLVRIPVNGDEQGEVTWINCDGCKQWFHIVCAGFKNDREVRTVDKFICRPCRPIHGQTTFVRKSSRARTAIDYAGLNQGVVKTSTDHPEHHYIQIIKDGKFRFLPESFPRMRPELVTAEYFERGNGMTEPIVIPAAFNTRKSVTPTGSDFDALVEEVSTQEMFDELLENQPDEAEDTEEVIDCGQDLLDMIVPQGLTVRAVAELYGPDERVEVIDVKSQQGEDKRWNMQKWADYYESTGPKVVRNVISLEVSQSRLGRLIRRPKIVRDLDLQDSVWPEELKAIGDYPKVQFYCLMSVADCYTDFHIDFGGSSVYYHILKGKKTFFFIPPKEKHLKKYEEWCNSPAQDTTFLGDQTKECYRVDLSEGDTMLIPSGWIHAVWTPENSLVIGGNFLTRMNYGMQIKVAKIEKDTKVPRKFRYPFFQKIQWYTALKYLEDDPIPDDVLESFTQDENFRFHRDYPIYYEFGERANQAPRGSAYYNSRFYSQAELEGLPDLAKYLLRTALIAGGYIVDGVTQETRNAVKRSIPKGHGDPVDTVRKFGVWIAWKRGNEKAPQWTRPGAIALNTKIDLSDKKPAGRPSRRSERTAESQRMYAERQAVRRLSDQASTSSSNGITGLVPTPADSSPVTIRKDSLSGPAVKEEGVKPRNAPKGSGLGPKRVACDACRKRRIRCRHKDEQNDASFMKTYTKQMAVDQFGPGVGMQSQTNLAHDAASVLNSLATIATEAAFHNGGNVARLETLGKHNSSLIGVPGAGLVKGADLVADGPNSAKKGRSKACDECRKSKRRCIHDEYGRIDPVKAQERSKPRGSNAAKRPRPGEEGAASSPNKKLKQGTEPEIVLPVTWGEGEPQTSQPAVGLAAPEIRTEAHPNDDLSNIDPLLQDHSQFEIGHGLSVSQNSYASPPALKPDAVVSSEVTSVPVHAEPTTSLVSPPTSLADDMDVSLDHPDANMRASIEEGQGGENSALHTPTSSSRHSSRQPRQIERYVLDSQPTKAASQPSSAHRPSSSTAGSVARRATPAPQSATKKPSSRPSSSHAKKSHSPAVDKKSDRSAVSSASPGQIGKSMKRDQATFAELEADAESLRLIRELQEQDFGLRKRGTRV
ncbi:hypothetical protein DTO212C5_8615 [Paecilomyces variotii]|nr:hypothetical protein DTO212C5_8615 [Paecilomyces variotii]